MEPAQHPPPQESTLHFLDYWRIIRIRKAIIITVFLLTAIIATLVTWILPEKYASMARIKIEPDLGNIPGMSGAPSSAGYDAYYIQTEFEIMQSEKVLGRVITKLNLNEEWGKKYNGGAPLKTDETMQILKGNMSLSPERNTKLIDITVYGDDKDEPAKLANAIAEAYHDYRVDILNSNTMQGITALEKQYQDDEQQIQAVQTNVDNLRKELKISDTDPNSIGPSPTLTQEQLQHYHSLMMESQMNYIKHQETLNRLKSLDMFKLRDELITINPDGALSDLLTKLHETQQQFATMTNDLGLANPDVIRVQSLIATLNSQIDDRVNGIMDAMETGELSEKAVLDALTAEVESGKITDQDEAERGQPYWEAKRDLESLRTYHTLLAAKIASTKTDLEIPHTTMVEIVDQAKPSKAPVKPNKPLNIILGVVIGLIVGIAMAFFIEYLDTSVKTIDDVERAFQVPVLGVIPQNVRSLIEEGPDSQHAEAYRVLRTNLLFSRKDDKLNSIVVVSAGAGEGKSTTTLNLATVFAQSGHRVIVVDSDLRRPTLHKLFKVTNNLGLTNYLLKQNTLEEVIQTTAVAGLDLMASGKLPSSSMNILGSASMKEMVAELKRRYDFVFFDSPPIMGVSDASVLASEMDMVVQVIQYRRYPQPMNIRAKQLIEKVGGNLIGIVLNNINMSQDESYYYYSGYYQGGYYSKNEDESDTETKEKDSGDTEIKQKY
jgi:succinoglycan biosynthesis transport protein ExoP